MHIFYPSTLFKFLTSYFYGKIRADIELLARLNKVSVVGAYCDYGVCAIDVTDRVFEFDAAFFYYLSTLPEYEPTCSPSFGTKKIGKVGFRVQKPHVVKMARIPKSKRGSLSFPIRVGDDLFNRTLIPFIWKSPASVLKEAMRQVVENEACLSEKHRAQVIESLHPDYRCLLQDAEKLALRVALINTSKRRESPKLELDY